MRWDYALIGLGIILLVLGFFPTAQHYLPELEEWNWAMTLSLHGSSDFPVFAVFELPVDVNDLNSLRVTSLSGDEHMVDFYLVDNNTIGVVTRLPADIRLYWGKDGALPVYLSPDIVDWHLNRKSDFVIEHEGDHWSYPYFHGGEIKLIRWDEDARGRLQYARDFPSLPVEESMEVKGSGWGYGAIYVPFSDENVPLSLGLPDDDDDEVVFDPSVDGVVVLTKEDGLLHVYVVQSGEVVATAEERRCFTLRVRRYSTDVQVLIDDSELYTGTVSQPLSRPTLYYTAWGDDSDLIRVKNWTVKTYIAHVDYDSTGVYLAPKRPRISVISPPNVVADNNVDITVEVTDPNGDLESVVLYLDGNELNTYTGSFSLTVELNDGEHSLRVVASDADGALSVVDRSFVVDTQPPEVNITYEQNDGNLEFEVNAEDLTPLTCTYSLDGNEQEFDCQHFIVSLEGCGEHTLTVTVCDQANHCYYETFSLGEPCPSTGGTTIIYVSSPEQEQPVVVQRVESGTKPAVQPASPLPVGGISWMMVLAVVLFFLMHVF